MWANTWFSWSLQVITASQCGNDTLKRSENLQSPHFLNSPFFHLWGELCFTGCCSWIHVIGIHHRAAAWGLPLEIKREIHLLPACYRHFNIFSQLTTGQMKAALSAEKSLLVSVQTTYKQHRTALPLSWHPEQISEITHKDSGEKRKPQIRLATLPSAAQFTSG